MKTKKQTYQIKNWSEYNRALVKRGSLTFWFDENAVTDWQSRDKTGKRGTEGIRGQRAMLDRDLAEMYEVSTKALNQAVKRNSRRFPEDFMFQLTQSESDSLRSQFVTLKKGRGEPDTDMTAIFHFDLVAEIQKLTYTPANPANREVSEFPAAEKLLKYRGWIEIHSELVGKSIYLVRDIRVKTPDPNITRYTPEEISALNGVKRENILLLHDAKILFGGDIKTDAIDLFITGLTEDERLAYNELTEIMTSGKLNDGFTMPDRWTTEEIEHYRLIPEEAHREAKTIIERYRHNQHER